MTIEIWQEGFCIFRTQQDSGSVSSHTTTSITDSAKSWTTDQYVGYALRFTSGTLSGNSYNITSNTADTITCSSADFSSLTDGDTYEINKDWNDLS